MYDIGYEVRVSLNADFTFSIFNSALNNYVKSFPKKSDDPIKRDKCAEDFSILSKNIKKCINKRKEILWENCWREESLDVNIWTRACFGNPVLRRVSETVEDAAKWNEYFRENKIEQAFEQLDEVRIDGLEVIDTKERYSGKALEIFMLQGLKSIGFSYDSEVLERGKYGVAIDIDHSAWLMGFGISIHTGDGVDSSISYKTIVTGSDITSKVKKLCGECYGLHNGV